MEKKTTNETNEQSLGSELERNEEVNE